MKLVELLAKELSEWKEGAHIAIQDLDKTIWFLEEGHKPIAYNGIEWKCESFFKIMISRPSGLADDYKDAIVTKEQWQSERERQKGREWKRHRGGKQPVADDVVVEYKLRNGYTDKWHARALSWSHAGGEGDVMKYRVISQPQAEEVEYRGPFHCAPAGEAVNAIECDIEFPSGVFTLEAKIDQIDGPIKWRDTVNELEAYIEEFTRERDALIERLASEGFALIPPVVSVVSEFSGDGMIFPIEEWKIGDIVEVVSVSDESSAPLGVFKITDIDASEPKYELDDQYFPNHEQMKFIRRP